MHCEGSYKYVVRQKSTKQIEESAISTCTAIQLESWKGSCEKRSCDGWGMCYGEGQENGGGPEEGGRPKRRRRGCVKADIEAVGAREEDVPDQQKWKD